MSKTQNIGLELTGTSENEVTQTFLSWRSAINGEGADSNMSLIDAAIGVLQRGKGDGLSIDDKTSILYMMCNGQRLGNGVQLSSGKWGDITGTIGNQTDLQNLLAGKANAADIPDVSSFITANVNNLRNYYSKTDTYSKAEINSRMSDKADVSDIPDVSGFVDSSDLDNYYTKSEVYTKAEVNEAANMFVWKEDVNDMLDRALENAGESFVSKEDLVDTLLDIVYPVGSIYISAQNVSPQVFLGGLWEEFGQGRVLIGAGTGTDTNSISKTFEAESTGGEYTHKLTTGEMPAHSHRLPYKSDDGSETGAGLTLTTSVNRKWTSSRTASNVSTASTGYIGGSGTTNTAAGTTTSHNIIQPYITVYMWKRLASSTVRFYNGDSMVYSEPVAEGGDAEDPVLAGKIEEPTKEEQSGTIYTFSGWSELPTGITENVRIYAQFSESYRVKYEQPDGTVLQENIVQPGGSVQYTGATPEMESSAEYNYTFNKWIGADNSSNGYVSRVNGPMIIVAMYNETVRTYTVVYRNDDGTTLYTENDVPYGSASVFSGQEPECSQYGTYEFLGWTPDPSYIVCDTICVATYKRIPGRIEYIDVLNDIESGVYKQKYAVGDYDILHYDPTSDEDTKIIMRIAGIDSDIDKDGNIIPITWISQYLLPTKYSMNATDTTSGGWETSVLRAELNNGSYFSAAYDLYDTIKDAKKSYYDYGDQSEHIIYDRIWIPSYHEVFGGSNYEQSGPVYSQAFGETEQRQLALMSNNVYQDDYVKTPVSWWVRSANGNSAFRTVGANGELGYQYASEPAGVAVGFCMGADTIQDSWDEIFSAFDDGTFSTKYQFGDTKVIDLGDEGKICFRVDTISDTYIRWQAETALSTLRVMDTEYISDGIENSDDRWEKSQLCVALYDIMARSLPGAIQRRLSNKYSSSDGFYIYSGYGSLKKRYGTSENCDYWVIGEHDNTDYNYAHPYTYVEDDIEYLSAKVDASEPNIHRGVVPVFYTGANREDTILDSWDEIFKSIEDGTYSSKYNIGDTKTAILGPNMGIVLMRIVAFDSDELADGTGTAAITWMGTHVCKKVEIQAEDTLYTWENSPFRTMLNSTIYNEIPSNIREHIKTVKKVSAAGRTYPENEGEDCITEDKLWIPSIRELILDLAYIEKDGVNYDYFSTVESRKSKDYYQSYDAAYALRSHCRTASETQRASVTEQGLIRRVSTSTGVENVVIGFCT